MSSHICLRIHFIWSTAGREALIHPDWEQRLFAYMGAILADRRGVLLAANGTSDHIHLYTSLPATVSLAEIVNALKSNSSRWVHDTLNAAAFGWQKGYGAFGVSPSLDHGVREYIANQKAAPMSFRSWLLKAAAPQLRGIGTGGLRVSQGFAMTVFWRVGHL